MIKSFLVPARVVDYIAEGDLGQALTYGTLPEDHDYHQADVDMVAKLLQTKPRKDDSVLLRKPTRADLTALAHYSGRLAEVSDHDPYDRSTANHLLQRIQDTLAAAPASTGAEGEPTGKELA